MLNNAITYLDQEITVQANTLLNAPLQQPESLNKLQSKYWPPVSAVEQFQLAFAEFLHGDDLQRENTLSQFRNGKRELYGEFIHTGLGEVYAYIFGYKDGMATQCTDDNLETKIFATKILLEREFMSYWIGDLYVPEFINQEELADYLEEFVVKNQGVNHPLFDYTP